MVLFSLGKEWLQTDVTEAACAYRGVKVKVNSRDVWRKVYRQQAEIERDVTEYMDFFFFFLCGSSRAGELISQSLCINGGFQDPAVQMLLDNLDCSGQEVGLET